VDDGREAEELRQPIAGPQLITLGGKPGTYSVAQGLVGRIRHPDRRQIAGSVTARQLLGVAPVGLDAIGGLRRHEVRRDDVAGDPHLAQLPVQHVLRRSRFIAHAQGSGPAELAHQFPDRLGPVRDHAQATDLPVRFSHRNRNRVCVDIQSDKS
jgi:hypothetical protein